MNWIDIFALLLAILGTLFFCAGTVGIIRLPEIYTRLHALTKADNLGLGLIVASLMLQTTNMAIILKLFIIWLLVMFAGAVSCYLIAYLARTQGIEHWRKN